MKEIKNFKKQWKLVNFVDMQLQEYIEKMKKVAK